MTGVQREQTLTEQISKEQLQDTNLERMVQIPTWRELLYEMVMLNNIDPWNIDVAQVTNKYIETIREMQMDDLRIPANLILAASILLRFKSDMINLDEPVQASLDEFVEPMHYNQIQTIELKGRIAPKGRVTLDELVKAVEKVFEEQKEREEKTAQKQIPPMDVTPIEIKMSEFNIDQQVKILWDKIENRLDTEGLVTFSNLLDKKDRLDVVYTFLPLLFLANEGKVSMRQDPFFGEIFIRLHEQKKSG